MNKVVSNCSQGADTQNDGSPVYGLDWAIQFVGLDVSLVADRKQVCRPASGLGGFAWGNDSLAGQISRGEIGFMGSSRGKDARSWSGPRGVFGLQGLNCERVLGQKTDYLAPRNLNGGKWIVNLDAAVVVDDLRHDYKNPNNHGDGKTIEQGHDGLSGVASLKERKESQGNNRISGDQVNPTRFSSKDVFVLHDFEITGIIPLEREFTAFSPRKVAA